jgi:iron complex transport system substrate-binding protein
VTVPATVDRIAEQYPSHVMTDLLLGAGDKLVAIPQNVKTIPFLRKVYPRISSIPELFRNGGAVNIEDLLARNPDVVSALGRGPAVQPLRAAGLPAVVMSFDTLEQLPRSITLAGSVYGGAAKDRAAAFNSYFDSKLSLIKSRLADLPEDQRPSVVHIASYPPLVVDSGPSLIGEWIRLGGGRDAASAVTGVHVGVSIEQLLAWNPDVLIIETPGGDQGLAAGSAQSVVDALAKTPGWRELKAIKTNRVYLNPQGLGPWDRYGPEEALQIQWVAKTLHPARFTDLDIRTEARTFYQTFFGYKLSAAELDQIFQVGQ